jgi:hypothetical protein
MPDELTQEELAALDAELLPRREALSVIGPLPAGAPGTDVAVDIPKMADPEAAAVSDGE